MRSLSGRRLEAGGRAVSGAGECRVWDQRGVVDAGLSADESRCDAGSGGPEAAGDEAEVVAREQLWPANKRVIEGTGPSSC